MKSLLLLIFIVVSPVLKAQDGDSNGLKIFLICTHPEAHPQLKIDLIYPNSNVICNEASPLHCGKVQVDYQLKADLYQVFAPHSDALNWKAYMDKFSAPLDGAQITAVHASSKYKFDYNIPADPEQILASFEFNDGVMPLTLNLRQGPSPMILECRNRARR